MWVIDVAVEMNFLHFKSKVLWQSSLAWREAEQIRKEIASAGIVKKIRKSLFGICLYNRLYI